MTRPDDVRVGDAVVASLLEAPEREVHLRFRPPHHDAREVQTVNEGDSASVRTVSIRVRDRLELGPQLLAYLVVSQTKRAVGEGRVTDCGSPAQGKQHGGRTKLRRRQRSDEPGTLAPCVGVQRRVIPRLCLELRLREKKHVQPPSYRLGVNESKTCVFKGQLQVSRSRRPL